MEEILQKLSEIELTAASIMTDAEKTKTSLSEELEKRCRDFDDPRWKKKPPRKFPTSVPIWKRTRTPS